MIAKTAETAVRVARGRGPSDDSPAEPARAAPLRAAPTGPDSERYIRTVRDPPFRIGDVAVDIGYRSLVGESPKCRCSPREAPSAAAAR